MKDCMALTTWSGALLRLLATVPREEMAKAEEVMRVINEKLSAADRESSQSPAAAGTDVSTKKLIAPVSP